MAIGALNFNPNVFSANVKQQQQVRFGNVTNPQAVSVQPVYQNNENVKNAFRVNYNSGELSPVVADGVRGNVLPRLYA